MITNLNVKELITDNYNEIKEYKELKEMYNELIKKLHIFLYNLEISNPVMLYEIYNIMYRNGMLSINESLKLQDNYLDIYGLYGIDILNGQSVCRHISSLLNDLAKEFGYDTRLLAIYLKKINKSKTNKLLKKTFNTRIIPNHIINQISIDNKNYIFDPTNQLILKKGNGNNLIEISGQKTKMIHTDKFQKIINWGFLSENISNDLIMNKKILLPSPTLEEINKNYQKISELFSAFQNTMKLFDFKNNNINLMEDIVYLAETVKNKKENNKIKTLKK